MSSLGPQAIFGDRVARLREVVVESVRETHDRHAAAQNTINPKSQLAYGGSIWAELPNNLCTAVRQEFLDTTVTKYPRARYSLPVLNDCIVYVWRPAGGQSPDEAPFFTSSLRADLFDADVLRQPTLFETHVVDPEGDLSDLEEVVTEADAEQRQVVLIAVTARSERLHVIEWGQVKRGKDSQLDWIGRESIFSFEEENYRPVPVSTHTFADGQPPAAIVTPRIEATNSDE
ncbi:hypothetical protein FK531_22100 [Rhodococcus spelaei]|uniref:Uncharacterized protein n=1 Tax=Rhodococcus spelaei TaxID=2546320 RepID=A0A541AZ28_9NOCA|nr:hypothetical protein [Rhodococcus spelaei]TQF65312.1 hypothetical protein FK531_22100 [Rhodococcus spelaei]